MKSHSHDISVSASEGPE